MFINCKFCNQEYPEEEFKKEFKDGTIETWNKCRACRFKWIEEKFKKRGWTKIAEVQKLNAIARKEDEISTLKQSLDA